MSNFGFAVTLMIALAALTVLSRPASLPTVAEFAPADTKIIDEATEAQDAELSNGTDPAVVVTESELAGPESMAGADTSEDPTGRAPSALQCVTWLDGSVTQTFDPHSPQCVATWREAASGNGGATAIGVTDTEIRVVAGYYPVEQWQKLADWFNTHYQFYGRHIVMVEGPHGLKQAPDVQVAAAHEVAEKSVFAQFDYNYYFTATAYADAISRLGVMYLQGAIAENFNSSTVALERDGLLWTYYQPFDVRLRTAANFVCDSLAGKPPFPEPNGLEAIGERRYAVLVPDYADGNATPDVSVFLDALAACGVQADVAHYNSDSVSANQFATPADSQVMIDLSQRGVTTLIPVSGLFEDWVGLMSVADKSNYRPEWILTGRPTIDETNTRLYFPRNQMVRAFGLWEEPGPLDSRLRPWSLAHAEAGSGIGHLEASYATMSMLAAGIQAAGPDLTLETFREGLQSTVFPNPRPWRPPYFQQGIGMGPKRHSFIGDFALIRWSSSSESRFDGQPGRWCWWDAGRRFTRDDSWPADFSFEPDSPCPPGDDL